MGYKAVSLKVQTGYTEQELIHKIGKMLRIRQFNIQIENKSLDARQKPDVVWQLRVGVNSPELKGSDRPVQPQPEISFKKRDSSVVVVGSGPAGFFAALVLQMAGFKVTLIERGSD